MLLLIEATCELPRSEFSFLRRQFQDILNRSVLIILLFYFSFPFLNTCCCGHEEVGLVVSRTGHVVVPLSSGGCGGGGVFGD